MQFPWTPWKKTHTKKIRVAHRVCIRSATEEIILSYNGENHIWTLFYDRPDGRLWRTGKRHSLISSRRWNMHKMIDTIFKEPFSGYQFLEIELETILEIYWFRKKYFEGHGQTDPKLIGGVIEDVNSSYNK